VLQRRRALLVAAKMHRTCFQTQDSFSSAYKCDNQCFSGGALCSWLQKCTARVSRHKTLSLQPVSVTTSASAAARFVSGCKNASQVFQDTELTLFSLLSCHFFSDVALSLWPSLLPCLSYGTAREREREREKEEEEKAREREKEKGRERGREAEREREEEGEGESTRTRARTRKTEKVYQHV